MKVKSLLKVIGDGTYVSIENSVGESLALNMAGSILKLGGADLLHRDVHVILPEQYRALGGRQGITIIVEGE